MKRFQIYEVVTQKAILLNKKNNKSYSTFYSEILILTRIKTKYIYITKLQVYFYIMVKCYNYIAITWL